uniref:Reverse transcriptase domain-containing protein n=1 Tax=Tanacetum cinerariifolium TaxID=118510 RepID=A0A6L2M6H5_TANCI|nr:reverse transcriptase domain-containing protein [Tanacetum cinerariifolium]
MADNHTMEELLQAPTERYREAIVIPEINADHFEIKANLLELVQVNPYHGFERENPHAHINNFKRITSTLKFKDVPNDVIKLMMFPYSLEGSARVWENVSKKNDRIDKIADQISTLVDIFAKKVVTPALVKVVEESCLTCGRPHAHYNCDDTNSNQPSVCVATGTYNQVAPQNCASNYMAPPGFAPVQNSQNRYADDLLLMPEFASTIKSLLTNKDKLFELAKIPLNENFSTMLLKKLPEKLGDPGKFLIPFDFLGMDVSNRSITHPTPTRMALELADRSITHPKGFTEDVFIKVGKFHFPTNFVVVDFKADPRVPLILGRSFLRTGRALIDVYGEEITLRVNDEAVTFNLNQTTRHSSRYDDLSGSDFFLEEIEAYLKDELISPEINHADCDPEGDICLIEKLLNNDPFQLPPIDLKQGEVVKEKSSIEEPPKLELKDLPSHLEYAYLEDEDKLPVIIAKDLKVDEKEALLKVLKSHKRAIAWKIIDIKGIDPRLCTHKILMEKDYKPAMQSQGRVNPKFHEVIKKEVIKLLDAGMIYLIFDSPWVSPIHCVPKKGGIIVVENETNELIPTWLVTRWRVCIDYRKLNDATRKDHFPISFMDQMLERL